MIRKPIALRYAKGLFDLYHSKSKLEDAIGYFEIFLKILKDNPSFDRFFQAPQISLPEKKKILKEFLNGNFDVHFVNFLLYLVDKGRWSYVRQIARDYIVLVEDYLGIWEADIVTAVKASDEDIKKLTDKLSYVYDRKFLVKNDVNPSIQGGAILALDNEVLDRSIAGRMKKLKDDLLKTGV